MKFIDGLKLIGTPAEIPGCLRDDLPEFFKEMGFMVGAEIGVYKGEFTEKFCKAGLQMYAIDPWEGYKGSGRSQRIQERQDFLYNQATERLFQYPSCKIIRKTSMNALDDFKDGSLDFVYIDGNHIFRYVAEDIYEWNKKVRVGGIVAGHDYYNTQPLANNVFCHVGVVVDAYTKLYNINWYIYGKCQYAYDNSRDVNHPDNRYYSWMFIKK